MSLINKSVVVITGAASGIGRALAIRLSKEGVRGLAISDWNENGLDETAELVGKYRHKNFASLTTHKVDVADIEQMQIFRDEVLSNHESVSHLINNAGVSLFGTVEEISFDDLKWLFDINFWGTVYGTKLFLPILREQRYAHIINVSSVFGMIAPPGNAAYSASKFAVRGFTESLRHELQNSNIAVSCVHPGGIATNIVRNGKVGANSSADVKAVSLKYHTKLSKTTSEQAAEIILKGIKRRSKRILIGADAHLIDVVNRVTPENYLSTLDFLSGGKMSEARKNIKK